MWHMVDIIESMTNDSVSVLTCGRLVIRPYRVLILDYVHISKFFSQDVLSLSYLEKLGGVNAI
jgi:hypothetical protein